MSLRSDPLDELVIPDATTVEEHDLVAAGDVLVGGQSRIEFGVRGRNVMAGERVQFGGAIEAEGDCRLDMWCDVDGNVLVGEDAYLGERVHVGGRLVVGGDLDIGDDVQVDEGFEANGWIVIRNPMPTIVFLFIYLSQLLRIGEEDAAQRLVAEVFDGAGGDGEPLVIPRGSEVSDDAWRVSTPARIGDGCRLHGNLRAREIIVGRDGVVFGSLRARADVTVGRGTEIKGDVTTRRGDVHVGPDVTIWGDVSAENVALHEDSTVEGAIRARGETRIHTEPVLDDDASDGAGDGSETDGPAGTDETDGETAGSESVESVEPDDPAEAGDDEPATAADEAPDASD